MRGTLLSPEFMGSYIVSGITENGRVFSNSCGMVLLIFALAVCVPKVWAAIPPWKQGGLAEFVLLSANEVPLNTCSAP